MTTSPQIRLRSEDAKALARLPVSKLLVMLREELKRRGLLSSVDAAIGGPMECTKCNGELEDVWVDDELLGMQCLECKHFYENPLNTRHDDVVGDVDNDNSEKQ